MARVLILLTALLFAGCAAAPAPTMPPAPDPSILVIPAPAPSVLMVPGPTQTITITPKICITALKDADAVIKNFDDWLNAMIKNDTTGANKLSDETGPLLDTYAKDRDSCAAAADIGT